MAFKLWGMEFGGSPKPVEPNKVQSQNTPPKSQEPQVQASSDSAPEANATSAEIEAEKKIEIVEDKITEIEKAVDAGDKNKAFSLRSEIVSILKGKPSELEVEKLLNPKNPEALVDFIAGVDNANTWFEMRVKSEYGHGKLNNFKNFMRGEWDYQIMPDNTVRHNIGKELGRKALSIFGNKKIALAAGMGAIIGVFTGGVGNIIQGVLAAKTIIFGGAAGRGAGEIWDILKGEEREARKQLMMSYVNEYSKLNLKAKEIKAQDDPIERNKKIAELIDLTYKMSQEVANSRKNVETIKASWNKTKDNFTSAGLIAGSALNIYHGLTNLHESTSDMKIDLDLDKHAHAVQKVGNDWYSLYDSNQDLTYMHDKAIGQILAKHPDWTQAHAEAIFNKYYTIKQGIGQFGGHLLPGVTDQQIALALEHARHNAPWIEVVKNIWPNVGTTLAVLGATFLSPLMEEKGKIEEMKASWLDSTGERLKKELPKVEEEKKEEEKKEENAEILKGQDWSFHEKLDKLGKLGQEAVITDIITQNKIDARFVEWRIIELDNDNVTMQDMTKGQNGIEVLGKRIIKISKKELLEKGKLIPTKEEKEKVEVDKKLESKYILSLKKQFDEGKDMIEFRPKLAKDFFSKNFNLNINTKEKYEITDFNIADNKLSLRNIDTGDTNEDLDLLKFSNAILSLKSKVEEKEKEKENKEKNKEENSEFQELMKKFRKKDKDKPIKDAVWYLSADIEGVDDDGDEIKLKKGYYRITEAPDKEELMISIKGVGEDNVKLFGKVKIEELLDDKYQGLSQLVEHKLEEAERAGKPIPTKKEIERNQIWNYLYNVGPNPDPAPPAGDTGYDYKISRIEEKTSAVTIVRNNPSPAPAQPRVFSRVVSQIDLIEKGTFQP